MKLCKTLVAEYELSTQENVNVQPLVPVYAVKPQTLASRDNLNRPRTHYSLS